MSTLLMSGNLIEPFISVSNDSKEYLNSFSDPTLMFNSELNLHPHNQQQHHHHHHQDHQQSIHQLSNNHHEHLEAITDANHFLHHHQHQHQHHHTTLDDGALVLNQHNHLNLSHNVVEQSTPSSSLSPTTNSTTLADMFKCVDDGVNYDDFHHDITLYSPCMIDDYTIDLTDNGWTSKPPDQWQPIEVAEWIRNWAHRNEVQDIEIAHLLYNQMSGCDLCQMQREYFTSVCPQYGHLIYDSLQTLMHQFRTNHYMTFELQTPSSSSSSSVCMPATIATTTTTNSDIVPLNHANHVMTVIGANNQLIPQQQSNTIDGSNFFPHISNLDSIPAHLTFEVQSSLLNYSPSNASVSDSDRESTSSNLSRINERRLPCNSYYPQVCLTQEMMIDSTRSSTNGSSNTPIMSNGKDPMTPSSPTTTTSNSNAKRNGRRGRPPKKENKSRSKGNGKLWEFIRDLLLNPLTNPSLIRWERREDGIFKFIQSDKVAKMWGERKQNPRMTYEKLSRAMRYYYKSKVLLPVFGRRLVYKFGPNATGWRPQFDMILNKNGTVSASHASA